jgi:Bacterial aa3 type cytochrome c oxidase subunit IV
MEGSMGSDNMDYKQHNKTYSGFITGMKWGIPLSLIMFFIMILLTDGR